MSVPTTTIRQLLDQTEFDRIGIVCDIEGAEADLISREMPTLQQHAEFIMLELHPAVLGRVQCNDILHTLREHGFEARQSIGDCVFLSSNTSHT